MAMKPCRECKKDVSTAAKTCPHCGISNPAGGGTSKGLKILLAVIAIIVGVNLLGRLAGGWRSTPGTSRGNTSAVSTKETALAGVSLDFIWSRGRSDNSMIANFSIANRSKYSIKDTQVTCVHKNADGTELGRSTRTIYDVVPAKKTKRVKGFNMGPMPVETKSSLCHISDLRIGGE